MNDECGTSTEDRPTSSSITCRSSFVVSWSCLLLTMLVGAQKPSSLEFVAQPIDGEMFAGRPVAIEHPWRISLQNSERRTFSGADLVALRRKEQLSVSSISGAQLLLANGDCIRATAVHADQEVLRANSELLGDLEIPLERVQALVLSTPAESAARELYLSDLATGSRRHDALILANGDELNGTFLELDDRRIRLEGSQGAMEVNRAGVRAIALSSELTEFPPPTDLYAKLFLSDGSAVAMLDGQMNDTNLCGRAAFDRPLAIPIDQVISIEWRNGRLTYLSDLQPAEFRHIPYFGISHPYRRDRTVAGNMITLRGQVFRKGLGVHSRSELSYDLDGQSKRFEAVIGIDDETAGKGSVIFRVLLDDKSVWESQTLTGQSSPQRIQIDVADAQRLTLVVDFGAMGHVQDHADWAEARLVR